MWLCAPVIQALGQRLEERCKFQASLNWEAGIFSDNRSWNAPEARGQMPLPVLPKTEQIRDALRGSSLPTPTLAALTLLMKDANRLFRHLICSFSSLFTFCTVGSISSSRGTSRLSLMVTGVMQAGDPQTAPARYPKPGMPHLEATRGLPKPTLHRLREPRQPRDRRPPPTPGRQDPLLTS